MKLFKLSILLERVNIMQFIPVPVVTHEQIKIAIATIGGTNLGR